MRGIYLDVPSSVGGHWAAAVTWAGGVTVKFLSIHSLALPSGVSSD